MLSTERTLAGTIDAIAASHPDRPWAHYATSQQTFEQGQLRTVTFATLANAVNKLARHIDTSLPSRETLQSVAYIGPSDLRYYILTCASAKCQIKSLFSSPRNNLESHLSLLEKTTCDTLLMPRERGQDPTLQSILAKRTMQCVEMPTLDELLEDEPVPSFPMLDLPWSELAHLPCLVLHTSGSTGMPKPIEIKHGLIATMDAHQHLPDVEGRGVTAKEYANRTMYSAMPPFHAAGLNLFSYSIFQGTQLVLGPNDQPPSVAIIEHILNFRLASAAFLAPSLLAELAADETLLPKLAQWSSVTYAGGPLPLEAGNAIWQYTRVMGLLGSTETNNLPELTPTSEDEWPYHCYHPSLGIEFQERGAGFSELVLSRVPGWKALQGCFWTFPDLDQYPMKDLYEQHPTKPGLWAMKGRTDDIIVLSNGEKVNPSGAERIIAQDPNVMSALIVGRGRTQPALLVEPSQDLSNVLAETRRASLAGSIELANEALPGHAQIHDSHVEVLDAPGNFLRSAKGEVRRAPTIELWGEKISKIFSDADSYSTGSVELDFGGRDLLQKSLVDLLSAEFVKDRVVLPEQDLFDCGFDSLRVMKLFRSIRTAVERQTVSPVVKFSPRLIYQNPSPAALAERLWALIGGQEDTMKNAHDSQAHMQRLLDSCTAHIDQMSATREQRHVVLLTGSTGSLGSYILDSLVRNSSVSRVICLNRAGSDSTRQAKLNRSRGLSENFSAVTFLEVELTQPQLGLSDAQYDELVREATCIVHNAWPVNFNLSLSAFEPQLEACQNLIDLANTSTRKPEITFVSSVGAANDWAKISDDPVPEALIEDFRAPEQMGYGQSKQLAELQFAHAGKRLGLPMTICRIGQIAGPVKSDQGSWSLNEWFPSLLASCKTLGKIPDILGGLSCMDWIPVDCLSEMLVQTVLHEQALDDSFAPQPCSPSVISALPDAISALPDAISAIPGAFPEVPETEEQQTTASSQSSLVTTPELSRSASFERVPSSRTSISSSIELESKDSANTSRFLHFVNPQKAQWQDVVQDVAPMLGDELKIVSYSEWLDALTAATERENSTVEIPAGKLLEFYRENGAEGAQRPTFACDAAQAASSTLRGLPAVSTEWFGRWIQQWRAAGETF